MPMSHVLCCENCGTQWRWLQMTSREPLPGCPNPACGGAVKKELAAPAISRDASPATSWAIPQSRAKREKFAYEMAEGMGATNIRDNQREGDIAALPAPDPVIKAPNGREIKVPVGFQQAGSSPEAVQASIHSLVGGAGGARVNKPALDVLGGIKRH